MQQKGAVTRIQAAVLVIILAIAGGATGFYAMQATQPAVEKRLTVSFALSSEEWEVLIKDVFPLFTEQTGVQVDPFDVRPEQLVSTLEAQTLAGDVRIDVFGQDNLALAQLVERDLVMDLSEFEDDIDTAIHQSLIDAGKFDGKLYFMPYRPNVQIAYYNIEKFEQYDLQPPMTWDELLDVAKTFYEEEGSGKALFKSWGAAPTMTQAFEYIVSAGGDPLEFNDEGNKAFFRFMQELWPYLSPDHVTAKWDTSNEALATGSAYIMQNWPFGVPVIADTLGFGRENLGTYSGWAGPVREAHVIGGEVMGVPRLSNQPDLAMDFIEFLQSKEVQEILASEMAWPSVRDDAFGEVPDWLQPHFDSISDAIAEGIFRPNVPYISDYQELFNEAYTRILVGGEDIDTVLDEMHGRMQAIIA